jgi:ATP-dependent DNA ligase
MKLRPPRQNRVRGARGDGPVPGGARHAIDAAARAEAEDMPLRSRPPVARPLRELQTDLPPMWVKPVLVVQVEYRKRTGEGLRHAALKGLRPDQSPRRVVQSTLS